MAPKLDIHVPAPDFALDDFRGRRVSLADFRDQQQVILVFNRGFMWPHCRRHMAQLRQDYQEFTQRQAEIVVVGPEDKEAFARFWEKEGFPFVGLPDPDHSVANRYGQEVSLFKLGRMPALLVIDKQGVIRYVHYGNSMQDIPANREVLAVLEELNRETAST